MTIISNIHPFERLVMLCRANAFPLLKVEFSEASDQYEIEISTGHIGESFYVKKCKHLEDGLKHIIAQIEQRSEDE